MAISHLGAHSNSLHSAAGSTARAADLTETFSDLRDMACEQFG